MATIPTDVATRAGQWDQQNIDLTSGSALVAEASTSGFTAAVQSVASAFTASWHGHVESLAIDAEGFADGLRDSIRAWWESDLAAQNSLTHDQDVLTLYVAMEEKR